MGEVGSVERFLLGFKGTNDVLSWGLKWKRLVDQPEKGCGFLSFFSLLICSRIGMARLEKKLVGERGRKVEENGTQQRCGQEEIGMLLSTFDYSGFKYGVTGRIMAVSWSL